MGRAAAAPLQALAMAQGHLFPFAPVFLGLGIGVYFGLLSEPPLWVLWMLLAAGAVAMVAALRGADLARPLLMALALTSLGFSAAGLRSHGVAAPVLGWSRYGPVEGRIIGVDRSVSGALRLLLDQVVLPGLSPARTPRRVRVSVQGDRLDVDPVAGTRVMLTGYLGPPPGPAEPGGFDFRRMAWFQQLGAVGYTRSPVLTLEPPTPGWALALTRLRQRISAAIRSRLPGEAGGFVAAILTGDRSGVPLATTEALRRSNLSHLLAISGLHMGLLTGVVFGGLRAALALVPGLALRLPIRKIAAIGALMAAAFYLGLSGGNIATQRAFVMAATMLGAVLVDRRAISLRSVAVAALIVLAWRPEALLSAGFHLSFAATVSLVAVFRALKDRRAGRARSRKRWARRALDPVLMAALSSLVAGLATAPIAAAHFNRIADYGLLANVISVPLMGLLVMPAAVLSALGWLLGAEGAGLWLMAQGTRWILGVAHTVGGWPGAVTLVSAPPRWVLPMLGLGGLWLALWQTRARWLGLAPMVIALGGWALAERPALLIAREGGLVGVMTAQGRALSKPRGAGFVARVWLENDGDPAAQTDAAARAGFQPVPGGAEIRFAGQRWRHLHGRRGQAAFAAACADGGIIVANFDAPTPAGPCQVLDAAYLERSGAIAVDQDGNLVSVRDLSGERLWTQP
tara:strand:- start:2044 stop:4101 length:2058 start_codon:yes stop_codon:yes gene_type:complete